MPSYTNTFGVPGGVSAATPIPMSGLNLPSYLSSQQLSMIGSMPQGNQQSLFGSAATPSSGSAMGGAPMQQQAFSSAAPPTYSQTIQTLGQMGDFYQPSSLVGGSGGGGSAPPGVNPMDLLTPIMMGQTTLPGGGSTGGTPAYSPYAPTGYQSSITREADPDQSPGVVAHALNDFAMGLGSPASGLGINYSQLAGDVNNPAFQQSLNPNVGLPAGFEQWQQQQNWNMLSGDLGNWINSH